ncbi:MAG: ATP-binding cassette domain-containing protein [Pirellulaceae bacterium]
MFAIKIFDRNLDLRIMLTLQNVGRDFLGQWAVRDISATWQAGQIVAILGANGAGKSTLVRLIAGWIPEVEAEVADWFERFDLTRLYRQEASQLSKGQRYKLALTCLFVTRPQIWLLDEPFSAGLDAAGLATLETELTAHARNGGLVLFTSQWPRHANRLATDAVVLHHGRIECHKRMEDQTPVTVPPDCDVSLAAVLNGLNGHV